MKRFIGGLIIGLLVGLNLPANATKQTPMPRVTVTASPTYDPAQYLRRYCYGLDMVYVIDNHEWNGTPSQVAVSTDSKECLREGGYADLKEGARLMK